MTQPAGFLEVPKTDERLYGVPILDGTKRVGTLVAGISLAPYEETRHEALVASLVMALVLLAVVGLAAWWLLRSALRPVALMTEQAAAWSEHDLDRRFLVGDPHDELTRLAATSTRCSTGSPRACATSASSPPSCLTSCARRSQSWSPRRSSLSGGTAPPTSTARRSVPCSQTQPS